MSFNIVFAKVQISEIMYDLDGADSTREWIEVYNTGNDAVDLSNWRLSEADTNHKLKLSKGSAIIPPQGYAIVADNASVFLQENSGFSGTVFDSSFSLSNKGESVSLLDKDLNKIDSVTYMSDWGAQGDGNSLSIINGVWKASSPTPGKANFSSSNSAPSFSDSSNEKVLNGSGAESSAGSTHLPPKKKKFITIFIGSDREVTVGAAEFFTADAYTENKEESPYVTYRWNFGNGVVQEGKKVLQQYDYPGVYVVWVAGITADRISSTARITVTALPANLYVSSVTPSYISLKNDSGRELDLSLWSLRAGGEIFMFPKNTILVSGATVTFSNISTGLNTSDAKSVALLYPNGREASIYTPKIHRVATVLRVNPSKNTSTVTSASGEESQVYTQSDSDSSRNGQAASIKTAIGKNSNNLFLWVFALFGILASAIFAIFLHRKDVSEGQEKGLTADDFEIIEDKKED